ncbi:hypothetical protein BaRGS_00027821 [Batillaria attramentaria]|uniref:Uncharacterized protein n=1 Tax=Batillaria attramentaria TaxID=370345 RepID=A0ABD0K232_9CAEN
MLGACLQLQNIFKQIFSTACGAWMATSTLKHCWGCVRAVKVTNRRRLFYQRPPDFRLRVVRKRLSDQLFSWAPHFRKENYIDELIIPVCTSGAYGKLH